MQAKPDRQETPISSASNGLIVIGEIINTSRR
jgi:hypothetical protein